MATYRGGFSVARTVESGDPVLSVTLHRYAEGKFYEDLGDGKHCRVQFIQYRDEWGSGNLLLSGYNTYHIGLVGQWVDRALKDLSLHSPESLIEGMIRNGLVRVEDNVSHVGWPSMRALSEWDSRPSWAAVMEPDGDQGLAWVNADDAATAKTLLIGVMAQDVERLQRWMTAGMVMRQWHPGGPPPLLEDVLRPLWVEL